MNWPDRSPATISNVTHTDSSPARSMFSMWVFMPSSNAEPWPGRGFTTTVWAMVPVASWAMAAGARKATASTTAQRMEPVKRMSASRLGRSDRAYR
jgi:hypothetical protein